MKQWKNVIPYKPFPLGQELAANKLEGATILLKLTIQSHYRAWIVGMVTDKEGREHEVCFDFDNWSNDQNADLPNAFHLKYKEKIKINDIDGAMRLEYDMF